MKRDPNLFLEKDVLRLIEESERLQRLAAAANREWLILRDRVASIRKLHDRLEAQRTARTRSERRE